MQSTLECATSFPELPSSAQTYQAELDLMGILSVQNGYTIEANADGSFQVVGRPRRILKWLGFAPAGPPNRDVGDLLREISKGWQTVGVFNPKLGHFSKVTQRVNYKDVLFIEVDVLLTHVKEGAEWPKFDISPMKSFPSIGQAYTYLSQFTSGRADSSENARAGQSEIESLVLDLQRLYAAVSEPESQARFELPHKIESALAASPQALTRLESLLKAGTFPDVVLYHVQSVLAFKSIRKMPGADDLAVWIVSQMQDVGRRTGAIHTLGDMDSDKALAFLLDLKPEHPSEAVGRDSGLIRAFEAAAGAANVERTNIILRAAFERLKPGEDLSGGAAVLFSQDSPAIDTFVKDQWENGLNNKAAIEAMVLRAYRESPQSNQFKGILEKGALTANFTVSETLDDLIPLAARFGVKGFLQYLETSSGIPEVRERAVMYLKILEARSTVRNPR
jgi:hypothetical protein